VGFTSAAKYILQKRLVGSMHLVTVFFIFFSDPVSGKTDRYGLKDENSLRLLIVLELNGGVEFDLVSFRLTTRRDAIVTFNFHLF